MSNRLYCAHIFLQIPHKLHDHLFVYLFIDHLTSMSMVEPPMRKVWKWTQVLAEGVSIYM